MFSTARLLIEPLRMDHTAEMFSGLSDPAAYDYIPDNPPADIASLKSRYRELSSSPLSPDETEKWFNWIIRIRDNRLAVGYLQTTLMLSSNNALISYHLFPEFWKQGYGKEAVSWLVGHLFQHLKVSKISALIDTRNERSINLVSAIGFKNQRFVSNADFFKNSVSHEYEFSLSPEDLR